MPKKTCWDHVVTISRGSNFDHCENAESSGMLWGCCFDVLQILSPSVRSRRCYLDQRSKAQHPLGQDSPWRIPRKSQQSSIQTLLSSSKLYKPLCTYLVVSSYTNINHQGWTGHCSLQSYWQVLAEVAALLKWMARSPGFIGKILPPCGSKGHLAAYAHSRICGDWMTSPESPSQPSGARSDLAA